MELNEIKKIDVSKMYKIYDDWPKIARIAFNTKIKQVNFDNLDNIIFAGMGGSGAIGDIFTAILSKTNIHVSVVKGYLLPRTVNKKSLVVITSVSGNTIEAITVLKKAKEIGSKIIVFSSGGKIEEFCRKNKIEFRQIRILHSPRASFAKYFYVILKTLQPIIPIKDEEIYESINQLEKTKKKISSKNLSSNNPSLRLAKWLNEQPLIYYPAGLEAAAIRFKNSLQENAKIHVISEDVVEACHNGIVAWGRKSNFKPILILGKDDYKKTKERWIVLKSFFKQNNIDFYEIKTTGTSIVTKIMDLIYLLDYASIYKGIMLGEDPSPVIPIEYIKKKIDNQL